MDFYCGGRECEGQIDRLHRIPKLCASIYRPVEKMFLRYEFVYIRILYYTRINMYYFFLFLFYIEGGLSSAIEMDDFFLFFRLAGGGVLDDGWWFLR